MFAKISLIMVSALLAALLLQFFARGHISELAVDILQAVFGMSLRNATELYHRVVRSNVDYILLGAAVVFFLILSRFLLSQFSNTLWK